LILNWKLKGKSWVENLSEETFVEQLLMLPGIDEIRARKIFEAGYNSINELRSATTQELMAIELINPTIARWIYNSLNEIPNDRAESTHSISISKLDIYTDESELDRKKIIKKIGQDPGRLICRFPHSKIFRFFPYLFLFSFILILIFFAILSSFILGTILILISIALPILLIFIIIIIIEFKIYYQDLLRIYELGIIVSHRRQGIIIGPPKTIWGFWFSPIWQNRFFYKFIPYESIVKLYPIIFLNRLAGIVVIENDGSWYVIYTFYLYPGNSNGGS